MKVDGACHCGAITYEAEVDPERVSLCHCADCQTLSGSPYRASVAAAAKDFRLLTGEPALYVKIADSGSRRAQAFCGACGSPLWATAADDPAAIRNLRVGTIAQRAALVPKKQIWMGSRQPWAEDLTALPGISGQT